jgi:biotin carboxylase
MLVVFETQWDRPQLELLRRSGGGAAAVHFSAPRDADVRWDLDVAGWVAAEARRRRGAVDGVFSSSDYPGAAAAAALAADLGLPGPTPRAVLTAAHKCLARRTQKEAVPEAVPPFALVEPEDPATWEHGLGYPCFAKPVKGSFSVFARRIGGPDELAALLTAPEVLQYRKQFLQMFDDLLRRFGIAERGRGFLCEGLLAGAQATVEGWCGAAGRSGVLGIVDSTFEPGTRSFTRFDYPSRLPAEVQQRMGALALRVAGALGLEHTLFNVELVWDPATGRIGIIEINPRICGQFADLYHKVDGTHGYGVAFDLATGRAPRLRQREGRFAAAASFPLRAFEPARVRRVPDAERLAALAREDPDTLVWIECQSGERLLDPGAGEAERDETDHEDGASHRYAVINLGGDSREHLAARLERLRADLGLELEPLGRPV